MVSSIFLLLLATLCQSLILSLPPLRFQGLHTHPSPSVSVCSMKLWWIYQKSTILVAKRQFKCLTQSSASERDKMFCYINQNILYMDNGKNTPLKICIPFVLPQQTDLKTYLILLFVTLESQTWTASHIAIREERIVLEKREYFGLFSRQITLWIIFLNVK